MPGILRCLQVTAVLLLAGTGTVGAQQRMDAPPAAMGVVARIAEKKGKFLERTSRAELWRSSALGVQVKRADPVLPRDIVRLRERVFINLSFNRPAFSTEVYLGSTETAATGSYEILENSLDTLGGLQLVVKQGVMVVDHARGKLLVIAGNIRNRIRVFGTTVLFAVDSASDSATVYVSEGHISFPDYGIDVRGSNRVWQLRAGQAPIEVFPPKAAPERWQRQVEYTSQSVWHGTSFWHSAAFLVPAATVVGGSVACLATKCLDHGTDIPAGSRGGVDVTIPE
jgi:hypothetical protein